MQYLVQDLQHDDFTGPFPSQCQAMSYAEKMNAQHKTRDRHKVRQLYIPAFMPVQIHGV